MGHPRCRDLASTSSSLQQCLLFVGDPSGGEGIPVGMGRNPAPWERAGPRDATEQDVQQYLNI